VFEIGNSLREARLRQSLELTEVELATKIRGKYLRALEDEQFDLLPAQTYVKGFLRTYAEYLGLDGQLYVDEYNTRYVTGEDESPYRPRRSSQVRRRRRQDSNIVVWTLAGIGVVTALVIAAWKYGGADEQQTVPSFGAGAGAVSTQSTQPKGKPEKKPVAARVVLTAARGDCWLAVHLRSAAGKQVFQGTLERGRSVPFTSKRLWINMGAPENLVVKVNGKARRLPSGSPSVVIVTRKGIAPAQA
jgi:Helix-turn-helix domain/RodZ C-terminal domain